MDTSINPGGIKFENPGAYKVIVKGRLGEEWSDRLAGMDITALSEDGDVYVTTLVGKLRDQAQLSGVLNALYDLHLPILLVEYLKAENDAQNALD